MSNAIQAGLRLTLTVAALSLPAAPVPAEETGRQLNCAVVNGVPISREECTGELERLKRSRSVKLFTATMLREINREAADNLIRRELIYQESRKSGISVAATAVDDEMARLKTRFANEMEFSSALSSLHVSEASLRNIVERGIAVRTYIDRQFAGQSTVTDEEKKGYYWSHPDTFKRPLQVRISHILVRTDGMTGKARAEAEKKIEGIREKLGKGESFDALARAYSECGSKEQGGDLGFFRRGEMARVVEDAVMNLKVGETSGVVEDRFGLHLIRLTDRKPEQVIAYEAAEGKISEYLKQEKAMEKANRYAGDLRKKAQVEINPAGM